MTGLDIAPNLLQQARKRAESEGLRIEFIEGDAEKLPQEAGHFDMVTSMFGAMFAPRPEVVASELMRVCRPGGLIAMANWTARGFVGQTSQSRAACAAATGLAVAFTVGRRIRGGRAIRRKGARRDDET